ncbi:MAG: Hsp20/alpha crystallin family protein [Oscillatoria sp. PMC 1068.18]|nr:Hsp20/alpha crystallin family protein [Oscillatoria sp. PMC 1076.18]MEC4991471.1 Hsp20/alpha crystallin family protein [Oscillatoria sp. PMC 1068.18]
MALVRWQPFREVDSLQREMNRLFDTFLADDSENRRPSLANFTPAAEIEETADAIHLRLEVPGMEAKDLDIQVTTEAVSISGERKSQFKSEDQGMTRTEFRYGQFQRVIPLPGKIKNSEVQADYKDGILQLFLPKAEEEKNKVVKVNIG